MTSNDLALFLPAVSQEVFGPISAPFYSFRPLPAEGGEPSPNDADAADAAPGAPANKATPSPCAPGAEVFCVRRTAEFLVPEKYYSKVGHRGWRWWNREAGAGAVQ